ncbi:hypothetical protein MTBBW1_1210020 [Desulfamplus magnetovallimortis]|uniref:Uncharacterized protein n=1 Tax=Desulfamplus magnetovallimortis TaxID=1246637 RepID=A0A1W1H665_9BACT|nr:hypothetical protein MTBBW1_1210020 [Desulfamplus magnetovallimortis]
MSILSFYPGYPDSDKSNNYRIWASFISQFTLSRTECPFFGDTVPESVKYFLYDMKDARI